MTGSRRHPLTGRIFLIGGLLAATATLALLAVGNAQDTVNEKTKPGGPDKPTVSYWHVWTDEQGVSHQGRCELKAFKDEVISPGAAPEWLDKLGTSGATVLVAVQPVGWVGEWHENPKPQWIVPLSGRWFVESMDGKRVEMGPGEASFGNDQNCKADVHGHKGHRSGTVGDQSSVLMIIQLDQDPATGQPCRFK